jgi:integrase
VRWREPGGRAGQVRQATLPTKRQAEAFAHRIEADKMAGTYIDPRRGRIFFNQYAETWLNSRPLRPSTLDTYRHHLRRHINPAFGPVPLDAIRREKIQAWVKHLCDQGLAPRTVRTSYGILASILRGAVLAERIARSRCVRITLPEIQPTEIHVLSLAQLRALADAIKPRYAITVLAGYGLGLRQGEALALSRSRIDFQHHTYRVDRQVAIRTRAGARPGFAPPTTRASRRTVPMPAFVEAALKQHIDQFVPDGDDRLITTTRGHLLRRSHYDQDILKPAVHAATLPQHTTFHALRHSYASAALAAGLPILDLSRHLGHAATTETTDTYGHLLPDTDDRTRRALDHLWNRGDPGGNPAAPSDPTRSESAGQDHGEAANRTEVPQQYGTPGDENTTRDTAGHQDIPIGTPRNIPNTAIRYEQSTARHYVAKSIGSLELAF